MVEADIGHTDGDRSKTRVFGVVVEVRCADIAVSAPPLQGICRPTGAGMDVHSHSTFDRQTWSQLRSSVPLLLSEDELALLLGVNEQLSIAEVEEIYLPLVRLINLHVRASRNLSGVTDEFVGRLTHRRPFIIAIAGSVAVGKSTIARLLQLLLSRWPDHPRVDLITTDGFLWSRAKLLRDGLMDRKGFPESYDVRQMIGFLAQVRAGEIARAPVYSHLEYDTLTDVFDTVDGPDILIFEGLNVLQIGVGLDRVHAPVFTASDFFDLSIYIDAETEAIEQWYLDRFLVLQQTRMQDPASYFHHLHDLSQDRAFDFGRELWNRINLPNLLENILPTRFRADVIIHKQPDHSVDHLMLRRF